MSIEKMKKEDLELLSYKDITNMILEEKGSMNTIDLFKLIASLLELPKGTVEKKVADYYTTLTTDKRFVLLEDGKWDLRDRHTSDKVIVPDEEEAEEEEEIEEEIKDEDDEDNFDADNRDDDAFDDDDDDLKDLVVLDEEELELEE